MGLFAYRGIDKQGRKVKGVIEIESLRAARLKLKSSGIYPTRVMEKSAMMKAERKSWVGQLTARVKLADLVTTTRQLSVLISSHVPLVASLQAVVEQAENQKLKSVLSDVKQQVNEGSSFADALSQYPDVFSEIFVNLVRAGEASGSLDKLLRRLADFLQSQHALTNKVKSAMTYPLAMAVIGGVALTLIFSFVVPKITRVLTDQKIPLPIYTEILIGLSEFMRDYWWLVLILAGLGYFMFRAWVRTEAGRIRFDRFKLDAPVIGNLNRRVAVSRFAKTLSTLLSGGVKLLEALKISKDVIGNKIFARAISEASENIEGGKSIADTLSQTGQFPPIVTHMIGIGEKTGELEHMLENVATGYDEEVANALESMTSLLEPMMIVIMGGVVGFVVISILVPMMQMTNIR
jgi:general secretion pathway protein F